MKLIATALMFGLCVAGAFYARDHGSDASGLLGFAALGMFILFIALVREGRD